MKSLHKYIAKDLCWIIYDYVYEKCYICRNHYPDDHFKEDRLGYLICIVCSIKKTKRFGSNMRDKRLQSRFPTIDVDYLFNPDNLK